MALSKAGNTRRTVRLRKLELIGAEVGDLIDALQEEDGGVVFILCGFPLDAHTWVRANKRKGKLYAILRNVEQLEKCKPYPQFVTVGNYHNADKYEAVRKRLVELKAVCINV